MTQRLKDGPNAQIDRGQPIDFEFNGKVLSGFAGDTLASALLASDRHLVGRSFKYHRPRGVFSAGSEEPNALITLNSHGRQDPNARATTTELHKGLSARSQNHRGSLGFDFLAVNDYLAPFLSAGFYYKTFMWPRRFWEKLYEPIIRSAAGLGRLSGEPDSDCYDKGFLHCDILIIGAGPAGLMSALTAARCGARVILVDEDFVAGGKLNAECHEIGGTSGASWAKAAISELASMDTVRIMMRSTAFGVFDHGLHGVLERHTNDFSEPQGKPRQTLWQIVARRSIVCAGALERSIAFGNNDRPGIMLAGSVRAYANRWSVAVGDRVAIFTNNSSGWRSAQDLVAAGVNVVAVIDSRTDVPVSNQHMLPGVQIYLGHKVVNTAGRRRLKSITLENGQCIYANCLAVSGGWSPTVHLTCHQRGRPVWDETIAGFVPAEGGAVGQTIAGAAKGIFELSNIFHDARAVARDALKDLGFKIGRAAKLPKVSHNEAYDITPLWHVGESRARAWVDLQNDVTTKDIKQSHAEGLHAVEHLKRYTTLGMATDQGKTSNVLGLAVMAECAGVCVPEVGTTIFRPPFTSVPIGAFAGRSRGKEFRPTRLAPSHTWAKEQGAVFVEAGAWMRAQWFPQNGDRNWLDTVNREVTLTRMGVGVCDVSTLGKIDIQGRDAGAFLNKIYTNGFAKLPIGKVRYGLMLREDGFAYDDGTTARLSETHYLMTTTTANAALVLRRMEFARQCLWPDMDVHLVSVTDGWAQFAVAGPRSRDLLRRIVDAEHDISDAAFPFMACGEITVCKGVKARLFRISFSGERAYEIAVPTRYGDSLIRTLMAEGKGMGVTPYGTEALSVMRIEKGHPVANELNGQTTALNLGLDKMVSRKKDCIGNVLSLREQLVREDGVRLVGFQPVDRLSKLTAGAHFVNVGDPVDTNHDQGWMSSVAFSPTLGHSIGLGFILRGFDRLGEQVRAVDQVRGTEILVEIVSPHFVDPKGERVRG